MPVLYPPVALALAQSVRAVPDAPGWWFEPKWDGWRGCLHVALGVVHSRSGTDPSRRFPEIVRAAHRQLGDVVLDGELVALRGGRLDFAALQSPPSRRTTEGITIHFMAFDLLGMDDQDLRKQPYHLRRELLEQALTPARGPIALTPATTDRQAALAWLNPDFAAVGIEGIVAKHSDGRYLGDRRDWIKVRHQERVDAVVIGVTGTVGHPDSLVLAQSDGRRAAARGRPVAALEPHHAGRPRGTTGPRDRGRADCTARGGGRLARPTRGDVPARPPEGRRRGGSGPRCRVRQVPPPPQGPARPSVTSQAATEPDSGPGRPSRRPGLPRAPHVLRLPDASEHGGGHARTPPMSRPPSPPGLGRPRRASRHHRAASLHVRSSGHSRIPGSLGLGFDDEPDTAVVAGGRWWLRPAEERQQPEAVAQALAQLDEQFLVGEGCRVRHLRGRALSFLLGDDAGSDQDVEGGHAEEGGDGPCGRHAR
ncbi:ATP dependent DNA ligase-like protein [Saccharothrix variisporea]|uniref:ATP dependent DNA ligase-like protein n=1 Tax=Saccharothrix variisporea TaxID=543527 RepID=A0A495XD38_9PSEU|nr:ATP dependent DNA ligase-like protein [Saccharothrix variisporea]